MVKNIYMAYVSTVVKKTSVVLQTERNIQLLSNFFIDSDFCHNYYHTLYLFECL